MTTPNPSTPEQSKQNDKELNFRMLEQKYEKQLAQERQARLEAEKKYQEREKPQSRDDDDDESDPYVDHKRLNKKLAKFGEQSKKQTQSEIQNAVQMALKEERKSNWIKSNPDFYDVLGHAEKFAQHDPELAETILEMPEGFERQKLVYKSIKSLGIHKPEVKAASVQEKIDANRRGAFYQPSGVGTAPYLSQGDFSKGGQEQAYKKMKELQNKLKI